MDKTLCIHYFFFYILININSLLNLINILINKFNLN